MTGRERLLAAYRRQEKDRVPWVPIIMADTLARYDETDPIAFTRHIGADVLWRWGGFLVTTQAIGCREHRQNGRRVLTWETPKGPLREVRQQNRILEHKLKSGADIAAFRSLVEATEYGPNPDAYEPLAARVSDAGIVAPHIGPTAVQRLVQMEAGVDGFAYLVADHPREMNELIELMHERDRERMTLAAQTPADVLIQVENTSTLLISPDMYRRWSRQHVRDFCRIAHAHGKVAMVHMCGHVNGLLDEIAGTGLDGIDALTPPPTADTTPADAWQAMGHQLIVHGVLDPTTWIQRPHGDIVAAMDRLLTPGMKERNFLLCTAADGLPDIPRETWDVLADAWHRFADR